MTDMKKAEAMKLSNSEIAARLIGFHGRYFEENTFKPGDVVKVSLGLRPSVVQNGEALSRFSIVLECCDSIRDMLKNNLMPDRPGIFLGYMDSDGDSCTGWAEAWRYELVTPADYRDSGLNG